MDLNFDFSNLDKEKKPTDPEVVETTPFDHFDLEKVEKEDSFVIIKQKIDIMESKAIELRVIDDSTFRTAMEMMVQLKALDKMADDFKKTHSIFKKIAEFKNGFDKLIRENIKQRTSKINDNLAPKIGFFQKTQAELERRKAAALAEEAAKKAREEAATAEKERKDQEETNRQAAIDLQAKLNLEADEAGVERVSVPIPEVSNEPIIPIIPEIPVTQKSEKVVADHGTAKIESVWIVTIVNPEMVGRNYCDPSQKKLDAAVAAGVREIAGCIIEESFDPKIRLSRKKKEIDFNF